MVSNIPEESGLGKGNHWLSPAAAATNSSSFTVRWSAQPLSLLDGAPEYEPQVWLGRVTDARQRTYALAEANRIGRSLGVVDAISLLRIEPDEKHELVATFQFGVGRVDYYDRFTT
jgi:hypothetical protein